MMVLCNKKVFYFLYVLVFYSGMLYAQDLPNPAELLKSSDSAYLPEKFKGKLLIENFNKGTLKQYFEMECFVDGNARYLLVFTNPGAMIGQSQLRLDNTIFSYVKRVDKVSQVSARINFYQSVLSQEDIMSSMLSTFYTIEKVEKKQGNDGRKLYSMFLIAKNRKVAYAKIIADVDAESLLPVARYYYAQSGQLVKEMRVESISSNGGKLESVKFRMIDALRQGVYSLVTMSDFDDNMKMPVSWFTIEYMKAAAK